MERTERAERSAIIEILEKSREEFQAAAAGVPESMASMRPEENRWSLIECVEHVATVEDIFLKRLASGEYKEAPAENKTKESELATRVVDRSTRRQAPETVVPNGRFTSLAHAMEHFHGARGRTLQFATDNAERLYTLASVHPVFGPLNGMEALILIASHGRRHTEQMREVRAALENAHA